MGSRTSLWLNRWKIGKQFISDWVIKSAYTEVKEGKQKEMTDEENIQSQPVYTVLKQYNLKRAKFQDWEEKD